MVGFSAELCLQSGFMPTINHDDIRLIFDISDSIKEGKERKWGEGGGGRQEEGMGW